MKIKQIVYGEGGHDSKKPKNNIISESIIDIDLDPITRIQFFLELSRLDLYKALVNNKNKLSEYNLIILENAPIFRIDSIFIREVMRILKIDFAAMEEIFYNAKRNRDV